jgi:CRP-like cAMP-binding protein
VAATLSRTVRGLIDDIAQMSLHPGRGRLAGYLLQAASSARDASGTITLPAKKSIIASRLNLTPEYFSRVLHDLASNGAIAVDGRHITILDEAILQASQVR